MTDIGNTAIQVSPVTENEMRDALSGFTSTINSFISRVVSLSEQAKVLEGLQETVKTLNERMANAEKVNDDLKYDLMVAQASADEANKASDNWQAQHSAAVQSITQAWQAHDERVKERDASRTALSETKSHLMEVEGRRATLQDQNNAFQAEIDRLKTSLDDSERHNSTLSLRLDESENERHRLTEKLDGVTRDQSNLTQALEDQRSENDRLSKDRDDWKSSYYQISEQLAEANKKLETIRQAHDNMKTVFETATQAYQAA